MAVITPEGIEIETLQTILARIEQRQRATIDPSLDVDPDSPLGQVNGVVARELALAWEQLETLYDATDPDKAEGALLDAICKLSGTARRGATHSTVTATCTLDAGTTLVSGTHWAEVLGAPDSRWTPAEDFTAPGTDDYPVVFRADEAGAETCAVGTLTVIATPVTGWGGITNGSEATVGHPVDSDSLLRLRREADVARTGSATVQAIRADVLACDTDHILSVDVFSNRTDDVNGDGMPPHSVEVLVFDGASPATENNTIAQAIYDSVGAGVTIHGSSSGIAVDPDSGASVAVPFSRPVVVSVHIAITVTGSVSGPALASYIATEAQKLAATGATIPWRRIDSLAFGFAGVTNVTSFAMGTSDNPVTAADVTITSRQIASFDAANIDVTVA